MFVYIDYRCMHAKDRAHHTQLFNFVAVVCVGGWVGMPEPHVRIEMFWGLGLHLGTHIVSELQLLVVSSAKGASILPLIYL